MAVHSIYVSHSPVHFCTLCWNLHLRKHVVISQAAHLGIWFYGRVTSDIAAGAECWCQISRISVNPVRNNGDTFFRSSHIRLQIQVYFHWGHFLAEGNQQMVVALVSFVLVYTPKYVSILNQFKDINCLLIEMTQPLLLWSLCWVQIVGYVLACRSCSFVCTLHHLIIIIVQTYLKTLNLWNACQIYFVECVRLSIFSQLSIVHYMGLCVFSLPIPLMMTEKVYTLSYYHHQIGSMKCYPLFRVRSWNNGMRCMSLYILILIE